jgi:hypothetical protein
MNKIKEGFIKYFLAFALIVHYLLIENIHSIGMVKYSPRYLYTANISFWIGLAVWLGVETSKQIMELYLRFRSGN